MTDLKSLADRLKGVMINGKEVTAEDLKVLLPSEGSAEVIVPRMNLLTDTELDAVKTTVSNGSKDSGFVDGMKSGAEQLVKAIRNSKGLEFEGKLKYDGQGKIDFDATANHVAEHFESKVLSDAKLKPDDKIKELQEKLEKVQNTYDTEKSQWDAKSKEFDTKVKSLNQDYFLETHLPQVEGLTKKQLAVLLKTDGHNVEFDENGIPYPTAFGKRIMDKMEKPVPFEVFALEYVEKNGWNKTSIGKGGGDDKPDLQAPQFKTKNEAYAHMEKNKIDPSSEKGQNILKSLGQE